MGLLQVVFQEISHILHDRWKIIIMIGMPIVFTCYFGMLFKGGFITDIKTIIVDQDQTTLSRQIVQQFREDQSFNAAYQTVNLEEARTLLRQEKADVIVFIPPRFTKHIKQLKPTEVLIMANGSNMAISSTAIKKASEIVFTYNAGTQIKVLEGKGFTSYTAERLILPVSFRYRYLHNPTGSYANFLFIGLVAAVVHFPLMLLTAVAIKGKQEEFKWQFFSGKLLAYVLLGLTELIICFAISVFCFHITFQINIWVFILISSCFSFAIAAWGIFFSVVISNPTISSELGMIIVLPALILSGYTWPLERFPWYIALLGRMEPITYFINPLRDMALTGEIVAEIWSGIIVLFGIGLAFSIAGMLIYRKKVIQYGRI